MTSQYQEKKIPALLKTPEKRNSIRYVNGMVELTLNDEILILPTADTFLKLIKKVMVLEQKLMNLETKTNRISGRSTRKQHDRK